jgi:hypothetical protein
VPRTSKHSHRDLNLNPPSQPGGFFIGPAPKISTLFPAAPLWVFTIAVMMQRTTLNWPQWSAELFVL